MDNELPTPVKQDIDRILDVMSGADGGVGFTMFLHGMLAFEKKANDFNDPSSKQLIDIVSKFRKLIDVLSKKA